MESQNDDDNTVNGANGASSLANESKNQEDLHMPGTDFSFLKNLNSKPSSSSGASESKDQELVGADISMLQYLKSVANHLERHTKVCNSAKYAWTRDLDEGATRNRGDADKSEGVAAPSDDFVMVEYNDKGDEDAHGRTSDYFCAINKSKNQALLGPDLSTLETLKSFANQIETLENFNSQNKDALDILGPDWLMVENLTSEEVDSTATWKEVAIKTAITLASKWVYRELVKEIDRMPNRYTKEVLTLYLWFIRLTVKLGVSPLPEIAMALLNKVVQGNEEDGLLSRMDVLMERLYHVAKQIEMLKKEDGIKESDYGCRKEFVVASLTEYAWTRDVDEGETINRGDADKIIEEDAILSDDFTKQTDH